MPLSMRFYRGSASSKVCPPGGHLGNGPKQDQDQALTSLSEDRPMSNLTMYQRI